MKSIYKLCTAMIILICATMGTRIYGSIQTNLIIANGLSTVVQFSVGSDKDMSKWTKWYLSNDLWNTTGYEGYLSTATYNNHTCIKTDVHYFNNSPIARKLLDDPSYYINPWYAHLSPGMVFISAMKTFGSLFDVGSRIYAILKDDNGHWNAAVNAFNPAVGKGSEVINMTSNVCSIVGISYVLNTRPIEDGYLDDYGYQSAVLIAPNVHIGMINQTDTLMHLNQSRNNGGTYGVHSFHKGTDLGPYTYRFLDIYSLDLSTGDFICTADPSVHSIPNTYYLDMRSYNGTKYYGTWAFTFPESSVKGEVSTGQVSFIPSKTTDGAIAAGSFGECIKGQTFTLTVKPAGAGMEIQ